MGVKQIIYQPTAETPGYTPVVFVDVDLNEEKFSKATVDGEPVRLPPRMSGPQRFTAGKEHMVPDELAAALLRLRPCPFILVKEKPTVKEKAEPVAKAKEKKEGGDK